MREAPEARNDVPMAYREIQETFKCRPALRIEFVDQRLEARHRILLVV